MSELSILTIVVSLAVCSILAVALYQYVNQRLSLAEHSQKEQAMILHQYIEESSYDIHCLKQQLSHAHKMGLGVSQGQAVYYQQYYQDNENNATEVDEVQHKCVHIDTVMYDAVMHNNAGKQSGSPRMNLNHRLIPVSSDSENTTTDDDSESGSDSESESESESESDSGSDSGSAYDNDSIKIIELSQEVTISKKNDTNAQDTDTDTDTDTDSDSCDSDSDTDSDSCDSESDSERKSARVENVNIIDTVQCHPAIVIDPAIVIESDIPLTLDSTSFDLAIESIAVEQLSDIVDLMNTTKIGEIAPETMPEVTSSIGTSSKQPVASTDAVTATQSQFAGMSVGELRQFIKDKCKQNPEKTAEIGDIQKMKKAALVHLAEQLH